MSVDNALSHDQLVDRLATLDLLKNVPREELLWLAARGAVRTLEVGQVLTSKDDVVNEMIVVFSGRIGLYIPIASGRRKLLEGVPGQILGVLPYSRVQRPPGDTCVEERLTILAIPREQVISMPIDCPHLTTVLVHHMLDRARDFRSAQMADERLHSLGRLASGLAHELNNPASAAARHARSLPKWIDGAERAAHDLAAAGLSAAQLETIDGVRRTCAGPAPARTALQAADREDDLAEWLERHGLDRVIAEALASSNVTIEALERLAECLPERALGVATRWVASACAARAVSHQIETSTGRIHDLVAAMKSFSFMDREDVPDDVDIARGLADTLVMLESKSRAKAVGIELETAPDLPRVHGFGSELNQLWEKLIDNALDAVSPEGRVSITASGRGDAVIVRVADDGPGIPKDIQARIFDPFFTTKPVGLGSGLGLYLARRVVHFHQGDLEFTSEPGRTVFKVRLPAIGQSTSRPRLNAI